MRSFIALTAFALLATRVNAHGQVNGASAAGTFNRGPNVYYAPAPENQATAIRTMFRSDSPAYLLPGDFRDASAMACERAAGAPASLTVRAGDSVNIQWTGATGELDGFAGVTDRHPWVHAMGPVLDYMARCNGPCSTTNAADLGWTKIAEFGLDTSQSISDELRGRMAAKPEEYHPRASDGAGLWGQAKLIQDGSSWNVKVPAGLQEGEYIIRHELASIHNPKTSNPTSGPQHYVACVQITVTNGGSVSLPAGTRASDLYDPDGEYANFNVYSNPYGMPMPGPAVWTPGSGDSAPAPAPAPATTSTPAPAATTTQEAAAPAQTSTPEAAAPAATSTQIAVVTPPTSSTAAPAPTETRLCRKRPTKREFSAAGFEAVGKGRMHRRRRAAPAHGVSF